MTTAHTLRVEYPIESVEVSAYRIPTEQQPEESDGTLSWSATTMILAEVTAGGRTGIGYTYADACTATLIWNVLRDVLLGKDALATAARYTEMRASIRNNGREGISSMAISALDIALWDVKGKLLELPASALIGAARSRVPIYGSGGFTSYAVGRLCEQLQCWVHEMGIPRVKMKVGRSPKDDPHRVNAAREAIGAEAELFVDANGAYSTKQAIALAQNFADAQVTWYEEPVDHDDLEGNRFVREHTAATMEISNGEYGYVPRNFRQILEARAADVVQADVTRCGGFSGFLAVDGLCEAHNVPLSTHCAPSVSLHAAAASKQLRHAEYFHDHVLIERRLFHGTPEPCEGALPVDLDRPGIGLEFKRADARMYLL